jgi:hypothetical protein
MKMAKTARKFDTGIPPQGSRITLKTKAIL